MSYERSYILAVETSSRLGSVALGRGKEMMGSVRFSSMAKHGVELIPTAKRLLDEISIQPDGIDIIAISAGPGSFTGLRVGFAFVRALAQITDAKLVAVASTDVIVENLRSMLANRSEPCSISVIIDAKRGQLFAAGFEWDGSKLEKTLADCVIFPDELLETMSTPMLVLGEGLMFHRDCFAREGIEIADEKYWRGEAENVYKLAWNLIENEQFVERDKLVPNYIRLPEAEERWQEKNKL